MFRLSCADVYDMRYRVLPRQKWFASEFRAPETASDCSAIVNLHLKCLGLSGVRICTERNQKFVPDSTSCHLHAGLPPPGLLWRAHSCVFGRRLARLEQLPRCFDTFGAALVYNYISCFPFLFLVISFRQLDIPFSRRLTHILSLSLVLLMCAERRRRRRAVLQLLHDFFLSTGMLFTLRDVIVTRTLFK